MKETEHEFIKNSLAQPMPLAPFLTLRLLLSDKDLSDLEEMWRLALQWEVFADGLGQYLRCSMEDSLLPNFYEEEQWVLSDEHGYPFTFVTLCETFGLNADSVRATLQRNRQLLKLRKAKQTSRS